MHRKSWLKRGLIALALVAPLSLAPSAGATKARDMCRAGGGIVTGSGLCGGGTMDGVCVGSRCA